MHENKKLVSLPWTNTLPHVPKRRMNGCRKSVQTIKAACARCEGKDQLSDRGVRAEREEHHPFCRVEKAHFAVPDSSGG